MLTFEEYLKEFIGSGTRSYNDWGLPDRIAGSLGPDNPDPFQGADAIKEPVPPTNKTLAAVLTAAEKEGFEVEMFGMGGISIKSGKNEGTLTPSMRNPKQTGKNITGVVFVMSATPPVRYIGTGTAPSVIAWMTQKLKSIK
jgi:hypothetical protein